MSSEVGEEGENPESKHTECSDECVMPLSHCGITIESKSFCCTMGCCTCFIGEKCREFNESQGEKRKDKREYHSCGKSLTQVVMFLESKSMKGPEFMFNVCIYEVRTYFFACYCNSDKNEAVGEYLRDDFRSLFEAWGKCAGDSEDEYCAEYVQEFTFIHSYLLLWFYINTLLVRCSVSSYVFCKHKV